MEVIPRVVIYKTNVKNDWPNIYEAMIETAIDIGKVTENEVNFIDPFCACWDKKSLKLNQKPKIVSTSVLVVGENKEGYKVVEECKTLEDALKTLKEINNLEEIYIKKQPPHFFKR